MNNHLRIGKIVRAHGVQGAVKVIPLTDDPHRFLALKEGYIEEQGKLRPIRITGAKLLNDGAQISIEGVTTRNDAELLRNAYLAVDRTHAVRLPEGRYFIADLIGCETFDTEGKAYGKITEVMQGPANDVYVIEDGKLMVPVLKRLLHQVDVENSRIVFAADVLQEVGLFAD